VAISTRDVKQKIRTVRSIQQICRAMKTVASIRLRRAEERLNLARPYRQQVASLTQRVASVTQEHPFLEVRPVERAALLVVTSDRGLAGGYNAGVVRAAMAASASATAAAEGRPAREVVVIPVGRKGQAQLGSRGYTLREGVVPLGGEPSIAAIWRLAGGVGDLYARREVDQVQLVYTRFLGGTRSQVTTEVVLPIRPSEAQAEDMLFEPDPQQLLVGLMDRYLRSQILGAVLEASASEHGARVAAMTNASENAEEMIETLTMAYNKARQSSITQELAEIVGTSEATA
jgi:F-type H+-transporting ATPase subunit gamma